MSPADPFTIPAEKPWYLFRHGEYHGAMPAFFPNTAFAWTAETARTFPAIKAELETMLRQRNAHFEPYFNKSLTSESAKWKTLPFYFWGVRNAANCDSCPQVETWLKTIPGLLSAAVSLLEPGTSIEPHFGDTNTIMRCHFGLSIPAGLPDCGLEVKNEQRAWTEGDWFLFCDAHRHRAWNKTEQPRYVLIVDVLLPNYAAEKKNIAANVRSMLRLQDYEQRHPSVVKWPGPLRGALRVWFKTLILLGLV